MAVEDPMSMINLFEYQNKADISESLENGLEEFLDEVWAKREKNPYFDQEQADKVENQQFLQFLHKTNQIKSNNYVGVIHFEGHRINLLPKVFFKPDQEYREVDIQNIQHHILWWLSYCRKIRFPNYQTNLDSTKGDFFEVLIYLFSKYTKALFQNSIYQAYEEIDRELPYIKGKLNVPAYIKENISRGIWHKLNCTFDMNTLDNKFNRIIKYVANILFAVTQEQDSKKNLREILFVLDDVADEPATAEQCQNLIFNPLFADFEVVRDYCHLFLSNSVQFTYKNNLKLFAFLLPMEYVFEDFIFGFIEKEVPQISVRSQRSDTYLAEGNRFRLRPDLFIDAKNVGIIADTKYKIINSNHDYDGEISQNDLYQMAAYAIRFGVEKVLLYFPDSLVGEPAAIPPIKIKDRLSDGREIVIYPTVLSIINKELFTMNAMADKAQINLFINTTIRLKEQIEKSIGSL
ncbi:MAG: hypothetical protein WDA14_12250 [Sphaerochaetaceae bacterium]